MKTFKLKSNLTFNAEDLTDAFKQLSVHFEQLSEGDNSDFEITSGIIELFPVKEEN